MKWQYYAPYPGAFPSFDNREVTPVLIGANSRLLKGIDYFVYSMPIGLGWDDTGKSICILRAFNKH